MRRRPPPRARPRVSATAPARTTQRRRAPPAYSLRARSRSPSPPASLAYPQPDERPLERRPRPRLFGGGRRSRRECSLSAVAGLLGAAGVDLLGVLGGLGEDDDPVRPYVHEPPEHRERLFDTALLHPELARSEGRKERGMVRKDPEVPLTSGGDDHVDVVLVDLALRGDDLEMEGHQPASPFAFSWAASMVPTM